MGGYGTELASRHGHYEGGRDALSGNVSYTEEQLVVPDVEIVKVSSHFLGRIEEGKHIYVVALRERREYIGQHGHLDAVGYPEFALHPFLLVVQFLVFHLSVHYGTQYEYYEQESKQLEKHHPETGTLYILVNGFLRDADGHFPSDISDGSGKADGLTDKIGIHGACQKRAVTADKLAERIWIEVETAHQTIQPSQGQVRRTDSYNIAALVPDGIGIGHYGGLCAAFIKIRFAPAPLPRFDGFGKPA